MNADSRYVLHGEIAFGGMAAVHIGRSLGAAGFSRTVAIKRLYPQFAKDPRFVAMFVDEARLAARIHHPNVVTTIDVVAVDGELSLIMDYIAGESLASLLALAHERGECIPPSIAVTIVLGALAGLHAAHEARSETGEPLEIVHRDVSPQNILVGVDGVPRLLDFGIAKARTRSHATEDGQLKGKLRYMAPEQLEEGTVTRRTDVYATGVVLWETLTGARLFAGENEGAIVTKVLAGAVQPPSALVPGLSARLDAIVLRALARDPAARFETAKAMQIALEAALVPARDRELSEWVLDKAAVALDERANLVLAIERGGRVPLDRSSVVGAGGTTTETLIVPARPVSANESEAPPKSARRSSGAGAEAPTSTVTLTAVRPVPPLRLEVVPPRSRRRRIALAGGALLAVALLIRTLAHAPVQTADSVTVKTGEVMKTSEIDLSPLPPPSSANPVAPPTPNPSAETLTSAPPPVAPPSLDRAAPSLPRVHVTSALTSAPSASAPAAKPACDPPYIEDANGFRHVRRECL